jgi:hypothetical protein
MTKAKSRLSTGDLQRELPAPEVIAGSRLWDIEALETFKSVVRRDYEGGGR